MILFEAIGRGETDRCLRGRDRRAVCLSERHVKPHLVIGDMATGQWADPFDEKIHPISDRSRSPDDPFSPKGTSSQVFRGLRFRSGSALPSAQAPENSLILIVARSHLDCRAAIRLLFEGEAEARIMRAGDYVEIPPHLRHRVEWTDPHQQTIWLAVHFRNEHS